MKDKTGERKTEASARIESPSQPCLRNPGPAAWRSSSASALANNRRKRRRASRFASLVPERRRSLVHGPGRERARSESIKVAAVKGTYEEAAGQ
jgi:hypothetical protein